MGLREHADLYDTVVWPHNPGQAVDDVMLTECILHTGCCSSLTVRISVHELACEVYPHSQTDVSGVYAACGRRMSLHTVWH